MLRQQSEIVLRGEFGGYDREIRGPSPVTTAVGAEHMESKLFISRRRPADDLWSTGARNPGPEEYYFDCLRKKGKA